MTKARPEPVFPVGFDEDALTKDLNRLPGSAEEGREGTMLGGCVKTYVPWPNGRFGAVFVAVTHPNRPMALRAFAFGVRHHPADSNAETVYEIAHRRLNRKTSS